MEGRRPLPDLPASYADSNGDGVGDLRGIVERLDHLAWLDVDGIWLNPVTVSPDADWGYDVADYTGVQPVLGTLDDVDALIAVANERDIKVILDLVPNHTSIEHPWFVESRSSATTPSAIGTCGPIRRRTGRHPTTGRAASAARPGRSTTRQASTTCTTSSPNSPTSTGGTRRCVQSSTTSSASGSTAAWPASGSTSCTWS